MSSSFKFRYVNELTGSFVLLSLLLALTALFYVAGTQRWFARVEKVRVLLPVDGSHGLRKGAEVQILGTAAGKVYKISIDHNGRMLAKLRLEPDFFQFLRTDSQAIIRKKIGLVASTYLELTPGKREPLPRKNARLEATAEKDLKTVVTEILAEVKKATLPTLEEYTRLAADLRNPEGPLQMLLLRISHIADTLQTGEGIMPKLLRDRSLATELEETLRGANVSLEGLQKTLKSAETTSSKLALMTDNVNRQLDSLPQLMALTKEVLGDTRQVMQSLQQATDRLPDIAGNLGTEMQALPGLLMQSTTTLEEIERLVLGLQRHWLVRKYVAPQGSPGRIPPEEIDLERTQR